MKPCIVICVVLVCGMLAASTNAQKGGDNEKTVVRSLKFKPLDPTVVFNIGGQSKLTQLENAKDVEKFVGKGAMKELVDQVDFEKESIVCVSWTTSGPPEGTLKHEIKVEGKDRKVNFFVQGPAGAKVRGQRARIGADFFAVPKNVGVAFEAKERP
jgi:hypothetical protein